jgi:predicted O-methyltransferase YrrM
MSEDDREPRCPRPASGGSARSPTLPNQLTAAIASGEVLRPDGTPAPLRGNVALPEAERLYDLVRSLQPSASVEIGLAHGISALAITKALDDNRRGVHYVIDPFQSSSWEAIGLANLRRANLSGRVRFYEAFPERVVPDLPPLGFGFIDGSHLFDLTVVDFVLVDKQLEVGGVIGFHDAWMPSLQKVLRYILANRNYRLYQDVPSQRLPEWSRRQRRINRVVRHLPRADRLFRPEVLRLSDDLGIPGTGLVFIQKTGTDDREPEFHQQF